jgi:hypothetical protein
MNGGLIQQRMYTGYGKAAKKIGFPCTQYRTDQLFNPIDPLYQIGTLDVAFSKTRLFHMPPQYADAVEVLWLDGNQVQPFDYLIGGIGTWFVAWMPPNLPIVAVRCNRTVQIDRPVSGSLDMTPIASGIPAFMLNTRLEMKSPPSSGGVQGAAQPLSHWRMQLALPDGTLQQFDQVTDEYGVKYTVNVPDFQRIGYVCEISQVL